MFEIIFGLQFGHGLVPWMTPAIAGRRRRIPLASIRPRVGAVDDQLVGVVDERLKEVLQFGHGLVPWMTVWALSNLSLAMWLQFGHGLVPWMTRSPTGR